MALTTTRPSWTVLTRIAHPILARMWLTLELPDEIAPRIRMTTEPMGSVGLSPAEARGLAAALVAAAEVSERREEAENDGVVWATDDQGTWFVTDYDPNLEVQFLDDGSVVITER